MKAKQYCLGIDSGQKTGIALWDRRQKKFIELKTITFWDCIRYLDGIVDDPGLDNIEVYMEDSEAHHSLYAKHRQRGGAAVLQKIAESVGRNKQDCRRLKEYMEERGIPYRLLIPGRQSMTKIDARSFQQVSGWSENSSEHSRDAAMLVLGR